MLDGRDAFHDHDAAEGGDRNGTQRGYPNENEDAIGLIPDVPGRRSVDLEAGEFDGSFRMFNSIAVSDASDSRSVSGAAGPPIDQAVRISACEAFFRSLSGSLLADVGD